MALWDAGGEPSPAILPLDDDTVRPHDPYYAGGKRRVSCSEGTDHNSEWIQIHKRPKYAGVASLSTPPACFVAQAPTRAESIPAHAREVAFFVRPYQSSPAPASGYQDADRQDQGYHDPEPGPEIESEPVFDYAVERNGLSKARSLASAVVGGACAMERTASGLSISSGITHTSSSTREQEDLGLLGDLEAAQVVREHLANFVRRSRRNSRHERILRTLINPKNRVAEFPIDDAALESIFSAANAIFFASRLSNRVTWDWSHESASQYQDSVIGTTALRRCKELNGYETLIVLSRPILMSDNFSRRLLISTFLHELIHSYLFISCGFKARESGGHTEGFHQIAAMIDCWAGPEHLRLQEMEADLESYRAEQEPQQERDICPHSEGHHQPYERPHLEIPYPLLESESRFSKSSRHFEDSHIPILRDQPHRLPQSRSQTSLRRRLHDDHQPQKHFHHHHHHTLSDTRFRHYRQEETWEGWIDDRWFGGQPNHTRATVPILVPVSVPETMPIRGSLGSGGAAETGVYVGYNA
ncbi:hypothetical protein VUR80DRAFT_2698 [Thermomyces stellatus]